MDKSETPLFRLTMGRKEGGFELLVVAPYIVKYGETAKRRVIRISPAKPKPDQVTVRGKLTPTSGRIRVILSPGSQLSFSGIIGPEAGEILPEGQEFRGLKFGGSCNVIIENISGKNR